MKYLRGHSYKLVYEKLMPKMKSRNELREKTLKK